MRSELRPTLGYPTPSRAQKTVALLVDGADLVAADERGRVTRHRLGEGAGAPAALGMWHQNTGRGIAHYLLVLDSQSRRLIEAPAECFEPDAVRRFAAQAELRWFDHTSNEAMPPKAPGAVVLIRRRWVIRVVAMLAGIAVVVVAATFLSPWLLLLLPVATTLAIVGVEAGRRVAWGRRRSRSPGPLP